MANDNTVTVGKLSLQIEPVGWRGTLARCPVAVHQHLDGMISVYYGPHRLGRDLAGGRPCPPRRRVINYFENRTDHLLLKADIFTG